MDNVHSAVEYYGAGTDADMGDEMIDRPAYDARSSSSFDVEHLYDDEKPVDRSESSYAVGEVRVEQHAHEHGQEQASASHHWHKPTFTQSAPSSTRAHSPNALQRYHPYRRACVARI